MRIAFYTLGGVIAALVAGGALLQVAIRHNGPAVLDTMDRIAGGNRGARLAETASTGPDPWQKALVWAPEKQSAPLPVLVFVHGGSWRDGDPDDYGFIGRAFVPEGFVVVLVGYRLGEEGVYPAMLEDTACAVRWTRDNIARHGGDPGRIVLAGHSAGAYNAVMTALDRRWLERAGVPADAIKGAIGMSGPYDFLPLDSESTIAAFGHVEELEATQPVAHVRADAPQVLLIHGEADTTVKARHTRALAERIKRAGGHALAVIVPEMDHADPLISLAAPLRPGRDLHELVAGFARAVSAEGKTSVPVQSRTR